MPLPEILHTFSLQSHFRIHIVWIYRVIPRYLKIFGFKPISSFLRENTKIIIRVNSQIFTNLPYIWFLKFRTKIAFTWMTVFRKNRENHIQGEFVKIREFTQIINFAFSPQKWQIYVENKNFEISRNSA